MTLLFSNAAMFKRSLRSTAAGAFARAAGSWLFNPMGAYRPFPRSTFIA
ncbi:MAG TPA: hypothetical protein VN693_00265 [Rhodanobacteraceae bacterium]|nr:hypothetical protein [Rhodanobacteraceae bacterium]